MQIRPHTILQNCMGTWGLPAGTEDPQIQVIDNVPPYGSQARESTYCIRFIAMVLLSRCSEA